jgi:CHAT domain-containing protein
MRLHRVNPKEGYDALALRAAERARARALLDSLTEARAEIRQGGSPELLQRERALQQKLDNTAERQARLLSSTHTEEQLAAIKRETEAALTEYQEIETEIRVNSPRYAALTQPVPLSVTQIQQSVDANTLLLEYALGDEKSYLWAVAPDFIQSFELPPRKEIESATRRVYDLLTARDKTIRFEKPDERHVRVAKADIDFISSSADLSKVLLGPISSQLKNKRLLIVSEGALNYLPFAALPTPLRTTTYNPLIVEHEIVSLPSASTLSVLRRELMGRAPALKTLAVIADPVFEKQDERVKGIKPVQRNNARPKSSMDLERTINLVKADIFQSTRQSDTEDAVTIHRLRFTRREAKEILLLVPESSRFKALDFDANRTTATSAILGQYRYVHFATHGFINSAHPELSGLVLSLVNREGARQDGFLWAHEIYNLHLRAEMVVLSGCRTGLGKEIKGEGLVGLTRGFMYAGAARVVVSLWDISDEASAELMAHLYKAILKEQKTPAAALRIAQIEILKERRWQAPYYWAAFVLQGEPR